MEGRCSPAWTCGRISGVAGLVFLAGATGCGRERPTVGQAPPAAVDGRTPTSAPELAASPGLEPETPGAGRSPFRPTAENAAPPPGPPPRGSRGMVWIPGGEFSMGAFDPSGHGGPGCGDPTADAQPVHRVYVDGFWMDATPVTNEAFAAFVRATGYVTVAERTPTAQEFPTAPPENLIAGSVVFAKPAGPVPLDSQFRWWTYLEGASWRHPTGAGSSLRGRERYPVVQVAFEDARAYARWAGKRLPTEAEFEFAARGGLSGERYAWGDELRPGGRWMANVFQGHFPDADTGADGWTGIAPVASFPANRYGLYDMAGNVWEWIADWYRPDYYATLDGGVARNPHGPEDSYDPSEPGVGKRVQRGGSFLCSSEYCTRYLVGSRGKGEPWSGANHLGFRCVTSALR
jgi:sulfatase modifying factor 1